MKLITSASLLFEANRNDEFRNPTHSSVTCLVRDANNGLHHQQIPYACETGTFITSKQRRATGLHHEVQVISAAIIVCVKNALSVQAAQLKAM